MSTWAPQGHWANCRRVAGKLLDDDIAESC